MDGLTRDNSQLSEPKNRQNDPQKRFAINCTNIDERVSELVRESISPNSRRAYASDLARFEEWGGTLPASESAVATYLTHHAETHAASTLTRWLASIAKAHRAAGYSDPTKDELVRSVLRGIRRVQKKKPRQAKPLLKEDLFQILNAMGSSIKDARDQALLLIGFAGGFRRSELVGLNCEDIEPVRQGVILTITRSKTDQIGRGRQIGIPYGRGRHCPITALERWLSLSEICEGPIFRPMDRYAHICSHRLSGEAVSLILKERLSALGIDASDYSGHSLRAGFATSAAMAGAPSWKIRQQTGHASDAMLARYIRQSDMFVDNAAGTLL